MENLKSTIQKRIKNPSRIAVLGIGSPLRGDDAAGMLCVDFLKDLLAVKISEGSVLVIGGDTAPENFTGVIRKFRPTHIILVDAADLPDKPAGAVAILDGDDTTSASFSTHRMPLSILMRYLEAELDCKTTLIGISAKQTKFNSPPSPEVSNAAKKVAHVVTELTSVTK